MTNPNSEAVVQVRGLTRTFDSQPALDGLDLDVYRGECLGMLGPNGAGKSTTVRILSTLLRRDGGSVSVLGLDPDRDGESLRARIGVVPQELALYGELTALENLGFFARLHGLDREGTDRAVTSALELAGLADRGGDRVKTYSGGMKRRLNLVVALVSEPELVFLDEPTVGIDPQSKNRIFEMVEELKGRGTTLVYTSHQLGEVERLCDRIVILDRGKKVAEGTLSELQRHSAVAAQGAATLRFVSLEEARRAREVLGREGLEQELEEDAPDLEQVFLALTGHGLRDGEVAS